VTVNQLNVSQSQDTALELARKLAFAIAAAEQAAQFEPPTIDATADNQSEGTDP
jgi:hypothetical protein